MKKFYTLMMLCALTLTSCATVFTGTKDTLSFSSNPEGARVLIDGLEVCKTPCTTKVKRSLSDKLAEIKLDGYETRVVNLDRKFNVVSVINLGSILGWGIDAATGALMKYDRKAYEIELDANKVVSLKNMNQIELDTENNVMSIYVVSE